MRLVQSVEVKPGDASIEKFPALRGGVLDAVGGRGLVVVSELFQASEHGGRDSGSA